MPAENIRRQGLLILAKASNLSLGVPPETLVVNKRNTIRLTTGRAVRMNSFSQTSSEIS